MQRELVALIQNAMTEGKKYDGHSWVGWIICKLCKQTSGDELECKHCNIVQARDNFAKKQRVPGEGVSMSLKPNLSPRSPLMFLSRCA